MPITAETSVSAKKESLGKTGCRPSGMPTMQREGWSEEPSLPGKQTGAVSLPPHCMSMTRAGTASGYASRRAGRSAGNMTPRTDWFQKHTSIRKAASATIQHLPMIKRET